MPKGKGPRKIRGEPLSRRQIGSRIGGDCAEYIFRIDAFTPCTMPMARLAEYMHELANMLGEKTFVHFRRLEQGSTVLVQDVDHEAIPKVRNRVMRVRGGVAPSDAQRAYRVLNRFLRDDNAMGLLEERTNKTHSQVVIEFPGRAQVGFGVSSVSQQGSIDGKVIRVGGKDETVPVWLESEGKQISGCYTNRTIAKELGKMLWEPVRLFGKGRWSRDLDGTWCLEAFKIDSFQSLSDASLTEAVTRLREIPTEWDDDSYKELIELRNGPTG